MTFENDTKNETDEKQTILFLVGHDTANEVGELTHELKSQCYIDLTVDQVQSLVDELVATGKLVRYLPNNPGEPIMYNTRHMPANY